MDNVVDLDAWRRRKADQTPPMLRRLDAAIERLDPLVRAARVGGMAPEIERELLAISGAVSIGLFDDAADRAERLAQRLRRRAARSS